MKGRKSNSTGEIFLSGFKKKLSEFLTEKKYTQLFVLCDENTHTLCLPLLVSAIPSIASAPQIKVYAGEQHKNIGALEYTWKRLTEEHADRRAVLINIGGGMICDLGGFAAATYKRGIDFIHIPTSLLAMVDASIGGKQGIDFMHFKNQLGVFKLPAATFINEAFLTTLPDHQLMSGFAEVVKHALIAGDRFWREVKSISDLRKVKWSHLIAESIAVKSVVVKKDPEEKNIRKVLNFGHTIGHAIESFLISKNQESLHGYCVAAGMISELYLSSACGGLRLKARDQAVDFIKKNFPAPAISEDDFDSIIALMKQDKKNVNGQIQMVLLEKIGQPVFDCAVNEANIKEALSFLLQGYK